MLTPHDQSPGKLPPRQKSLPLLALGLVLALALGGCAQDVPETLITFADARTHPARFIDTGEQGDSVGDILTFDQPLLDVKRQPFGNNSGTCIRTNVGHSFQCQWTLTLPNGTIQVNGREFDQGISTLAISGGTGKYAGISGEMESINNNDGTFTQTLRYRLTPPVRR